MSWILLSYVVSTHAVLDRREFKENGYDCGDAFFNDHMVHDAFITVSSGAGRNFLLPYSGSLYSSAMRYVTWPILPMGSRISKTKSIWQKATYQIVFDENGKVIDLIVRLANYQFAKCWRVDTQRPEASIYSVEGSNGYECGPEFIPDGTITECTRIARDNLEKGYYYPLQYRGNLYSEDLGYKIWPIYHRDSKIHKFPKDPRASSYFMVIDSTGQLKDIVVRTSRNNFIRCMRARKVSPAPETDELSQIFAKPTRYGYICDKEFFDDTYLQRASKMAKRIQETKGANNFPKSYNGEPFNSPCWLWPLKKNGDSFTVGRVGKYLLVLDLDFGIMSVAMEGEKKLVQCNRRTIPGGYQDRSSYRCDSEVFSHKQLASTAKIACKNKNKTLKVTYPAPYKGLKFDVEGPYLIYPIKKNKYSCCLGKHRLVINTLCQIAGVLTMDPITQELIKCSVESPEDLQER
ncbi:hypothetical protein EPUL_000809 [Erysiphe pulchra]|uniref:Uncharacterized protein n=1 Tax=Erysiphe pulchra TaxID=225359 RepID=A0A2S4PVE5_9PEZI|nr:hypothetical protein EPUL_000809 [Erysiphe pulchra]